jgi:hypothetical protein
MPGLTTCRGLRYASHSLGTLASAQPKFGYCARRLDRFCNVQCGGKGTDSAEANQAVMMMDLGVEKEIGEESEWLTPRGVTWPTYREMQVPSPMVAQCSHKRRGLLIGEFSLHHSPPSPVPPTEQRGCVLAMVRDLAYSHLLIRSRLFRLLLNHLLTHCSIGLAIYSALPHTHTRRHGARC